MCRDWAVGGTLGRKRDKQKPGLGTKNELPLMSNIPVNLSTDPNYNAGSVEGAEEKGRGHATGSPRLAP